MILAATTLTLTQQGQWQGCTAKVALLRCIGVQNAMQCRLAQSEVAKKMDTHNN